MSLHTSAERPASTGLSKWRLFTILATLPIVGAFAIAFQYPDVEGMRTVVIMSVRYSLVLFWLAFCASSIYEFWPTPGSRWLLNNRRYIGLSFAVAHTVHIIALIIYAVVWPDVYDKHSRLLSEILGVIGYAFVLAMAATSFAKPRAWLGPARWKTLHTIGGYAIWAVFVYMFTKRFMAHPNDPIFSAGLALLVASVFLRLQARRARSKSVVAS